jgi:hypothetical protein
VPVELSRPAELAHIAARAMTQGASALEFHVRHAVSPHSEGYPAGRQDPPDEAACFIACGIEVSAAIWPSKISPTEQTMVNVREVNGALASEAGLSWRGSAVLNPAFLYGNARRTEILVSFGDRGWNPSYRDSRMLTRIIGRLAAAAVDGARGPIMLLQSPVSPFKEAVGHNRGDGSGELLRDAEGPCLRMWVGIDPFEPSRRLLFDEQVRAVAVEYGLGLRIADRRSNRVRGEWFKVHNFDTARYRRCRDEMFGWAPDETPVTAFAVTVVGPARVGSTLAVVKAFEASNIGVVAYASESLTEISIAHMVVPVAPARLDRVADIRAAAEPLEQGLRQLARHCGLTPRSRAGTQARVDFTPALGYQVLRSEPAPVSVRGPNSQPLYAIWASLDVPYEKISAVAVIQQMLEALRSRVPSADLVYLRCHRTATNRVRARAKLAITMSPVSTRLRGAAISEVCAEAQAESRRRVAALGSLREGEFRIRVAWREKWLSVSRTAL